MLKTRTVVLQNVHKIKHRHRSHQFMEIGCGQATIHHLIMTQ